MEWYYAKGEEQVGPIDAADLRKLIEEGLSNSTLVWKKGMVDWVPFSQSELAAGPVIPTLEATPGTNPNPYASPDSMLQPEPVDGPPGDPQMLMGRDPKFDLGSCISRAWKLILGDFWPIIGVSAMLYLIFYAGSSILSVLAYVVYIPLYAGLDLYLLRKIRHQYAGVEASFGGFSKHFLPLFLMGLIMGAVWLIFIPATLWYFIPDGGTATFTEDLPTIPSIVTVVLSIVALLVVTYFGIIWSFAKTLCIDKKLGVKDSLLVSQKVIGRKWWGFFALKFVAGLLSMLGILGFCIGMFVTMPIYYLAILYAYEDTFGDEPTPDPQPPRKLGPPPEA